MFVVAQHYGNMDDLMDMLQICNDLMVSFIPMFSKFTVKQWHSKGEYRNLILEIQKCFTDSQGATRILLVDLFLEINYENLSISRIQLPSIIQALSLKNLSRSSVERIEALT